MKLESKISKVKSKFGINREDSFYGKTLLLKHNLTYATEDFPSDEENVCSKAGIQKSIKYYLRNTTLHGLKYLAEERITITERFVLVY